MLKSTLLLLFMLGGCPLAACANIGETPGQVAARYGKPTATDFVLDERVPSESGTLYSKDGLDVFVYFEGGVSVLERYQKREKLQFSAEEVDTLLEQNGHGAVWKGEQSAQARTHYLATPASGSELTATWHHGERTRGLTVLTVKYETARNDVIARAKALQPQ